MPSRPKEFSITATDNTKPPFAPPSLSHQILIHRVLFQYCSLRIEHSAFGRPSIRLLEISKHCLCQGYNPNSGLSQQGSLDETWQSFLRSGAFRPY